MSEYVVAEFVRAIEGAPRQRSSGGEMNAWWKAALIHPFHVDVVETHDDTQRLAQSVNADRAGLVELGLRPSRCGGLHRLGR